MQLTDMCENNEITVIYYIWWWLLCYCWSVYSFRQAKFIPEKLGVSVLTLQDNITEYHNTTLYCWRHEAPLIHLIHDFHESENWHSFLQM